MMQKNKIMSAYTFFSIVIAIAIVIFNINSICYAKYTFNYTIEAANVEIIV